MPFIVGTAGHIDHGKTTLVKALTGQDTDRLKEEKARGISIDLGFAHLELSDGSRVGIVDVPGHERFIRNMLAGAHGMDLVLFTVAADDGIMPQTEEHLDIVHVLGVSRAIWIITKTDLVSAERVRQVEEDIRTLAANTALEAAPIRKFSSRTGEGLTAIRESIEDILRTSSNAVSGSGYFRMPVDRVFQLQGHGLIVTGTATSGVVQVGDVVTCVPGSHALRVRQLQVHNEPADSARQGQRIALNLAGHELPTLLRGHVVCDDRLAWESRQFDAWCELRPAARVPLKQSQRVRVYVGTAERLGRVRLLDRQQLEPGETAYCQVALRDAVHVVRGDRFVMRDETARHTLGGGAVLRPQANRHKRSDAAVIRNLKVLHIGPLAAVVETFVQQGREFGVSLDEICRFLNVQESDATAAIGRMAAIRRLDLDRLYTTIARWNAVREQVLKALATFHAENPSLPGMDGELLRESLPFVVDSRVFRAIVEEYEKEKAVVREGPVLRLPSHTITFADEDHRLLARLEELFRENPATPPNLAALQERLGLQHAKLGDIMKSLERQHIVIRVSADLYFLADYILSVTNMLKEQWAGNREITPSAFRDVIGTSRKYAIPLLEYFDRAGITFRRGDMRRLRAS